MGCGGQRVEAHARQPAAAGAQLAGVASGDDEAAGEFTLDVPGDAGLARKQHAEPVGRQPPHLERGIRDDRCGVGRIGDQGHRAERVAGGQQAGLDVEVFVRPLADGRRRLAGLDHVDAVALLAFADDVLAWLEFDLLQLAGERDKVDAGDAGEYRNACERAR